MSTRVVVTGGAGFIGSHLVRKLTEEGHQVLVIDDLSSGDNDVLAMVKVADCRDYAAMKVIFREWKPEVVYHLAANAAENKAQFSPVDVTTRNYQAFIATLTAAIPNGLKKFIFVSSIAVYGDGQTPFKESDKPEPEDLYGISKLAAEQSLKVMSEVHGFDYVILRPHNVYGPGQNMRDPYRNVVTIWMNSILRGNPYYIYGDGDQVRCFTYIRDITTALVESLGISKQTLNVGSEKPTTLKELAETIRVVVGTKQEPEYLPERPQEVKEAVSDHSLAREVLGLHDSVSLTEGLEETWKWVQDRGAVEPIYTELEIPSDKAPKNWSHESQ